MFRFARLSIIGFLALALFAPLASAHPPFVVFGGYYGPAYYGPGWVGPYGYFYGPGPNAGSVKIDSKTKDAAVYVDGGYAGTVKQLKSFHLRAGNHDIELRDASGHSFYQERIDVIGGKTVKISPDIRS